MATGIVSFDFERADGAPAILGTVHLVPTGYRQDLGVIVVPEALTIAVTGGPQAKTVAATTAAWKYAVTEDLGTKHRRRYVIDVPAGLTTDLSTAPHLEAPLSFVTVVQTVNGIRPDSAGNVDVAGGGGGGGGVASVTPADATILITNTATNPKVGVGVIPESKVTNLVADLASKVPNTRSVGAGTGLSGGGDLTADRSLAVVYGSIAGTATQGNDPRNSDARAPLAHSHAESDVTNLVPDLAGKIAAAIVDVAGDLIVGTGPDAVTRFAVGTSGQVLTVDLSQPSRFRYQDRVRSAYPFSGDALIAASADLDNFRDNSPLGAGAGYARMLVPAGKAITTCWSALHAAGTVGAGGENGFAIYDDAGNKVTQTVSDDNLWTAIGPRSKALPAPVAAQDVDRFVYLGLRVSGYSVPPSFPFMQGSSNAGLLDGGFGGGHRRYLTTGGSSWAATIDVVAGASGSGFMPFMAIA
jgi:hypothetical protein